jgi:hypothetical protein
MISEKTKVKLSEARKKNNPGSFKRGEMNPGKHKSDKWKENISNSKKGKPAWNRGIKGTGGHNKTSFKKGRAPWNKGKTYKGWKWKKGTKTPESQAIRNSREYRLWRTAIFEKNNFTCQKSGQRGGRLEAHHINNFEEKKELRLAIDNGITLSEKSHKEFHRIYSKKNNTREQLVEFLNNL